MPESLRSSRVFDGDRAAVLEEFPLSGLPHEAVTELSEVEGAVRSKGGLGVRRRRASDHYPCRYIRRGILGYDIDRYIRGEMTRRKPFGPGSHGGSYSVAPLNE